MAVLAALGVALTLFAAPRTNRIFYDEQIYQGIAQNIADVRLAQVCNDGSVEYGRLRCAAGDPTSSLMPIPMHSAWPIASLACMSQRRLP